jgi:D-alanine-D-alanine ligase
MPRPYIILGGPSLEHDVSILTGLQVARVLTRSNQEPAVLYWSESNSWFRVPSGLKASAFLGGVPAEARAVSLVLGGREPGFYVTRSLGRRDRIDISAAVVCCHGGPGEDGRLQGLLDLAGIPYTGPSAACAALTMDKLAFNAVMASAGLPTLPRIAWAASSQAPDFPGPYIVKPRFGGSSIGIEIVGSVQTARDLVRTSQYFLRGAVLEPYRPNLKDLYIAIRSYPNPQLSLIESPRPRISNSSGHDNIQIYGYRQKYLEQQGAESKASEIPALLPEETGKLVRTIAKEAAHLTGLTGAARLDFLWDGSEVWVNELNSIPGALAFRLWAESGVSHDHLLSDIIAEAMAQPKLKQALDPPDRYASERKMQTLQVASKIAQKLTGDVKATHDRQQGD